MSFWNNEWEEVDQQHRMLISRI